MNRGLWRPGYPPMRLAEVGASHPESFAQWLLCSVDDNRAISRELRFPTSALSANRRLRTRAPVPCPTGSSGLFRWSLPEQELSYCGIFGQADRSVISVLGFRAMPKKLQQVSANRPIGLVSRDCVLLDCIQNC